MARRGHPMADDLRLRSHEVGRRAVLVVQSARHVPHGDAARDESPDGRQRRLLVGHGVGARALERARQRFGVVGQTLVALPLAHIRRKRPLRGEQGQLLPGFHEGRKAFFAQAPRVFRVAARHFLALCGRRGAQAGAFQDEHAERQRGRGRFSCARLAGRRQRQAPAHGIPHDHRSKAAALLLHVAQEGEQGVRNRLQGVGSGILGTFAFALAHEVERMHRTLASQTRRHFVPHIRALREPVQQHEGVWNARSRDAVAREEGSARRGIAAREGDGARASSGACEGGLVRALPTHGPVAHALI